MNGALPQWLERWLGVPAAGSGEGTSWGLDSTWAWAPWVTLSFALAAAFWVLFWYAREVSSAGRAYRLLLALLRLTLVALLLFMLAGFVLSMHRTGLPYVVVLVDDSASMATVDRYDEKQVRQAVAKWMKAAQAEEGSRLNLGKGLLLADDAALVRRIGQRFKLKMYFVSAAARPQTTDVGELIAAIRNLEPTGEVSRLGEAVETVLNDLRGNPPSALVLLSDGINTEGATLADAAQEARRKGVPLFTVALGSETPIRDLELSDLLVDEVVFVDDVVNFEFKLSHSGLAGQSAKVVLRREGERDVLAETTVTLADEGQAVKARLPYRPTEVGDFDFVVEATPLADEHKRDNNRQRRRVSVRNDQVRVLLAESYPSYEFRYLKHLLERDSTIKLHTVLEEADPEYAQLDETALAVFPVRREELFEYDVLIVGDVSPSFLSSSSLANIAAFVEEKGGGIVFIAGPRHMPLDYRDTPLADLLPIDFTAAGSGDLDGQVINEAFQFQPTEMGLTGPTMQLGDTPAATAEIWAKLPPLYWFFQAPALKPGATVWAEHPLRSAADGRNLPLVAMQYAGPGKVIFHATDETWRWRFRVGDIYFARYWVQTVRYLSRSKLLGKDRSAELTADRREYRRGENVRLRLHFLDPRQAPSDDDAVTLIVEREGDKNRRVRLTRHAANQGIFEGTFSAPADGDYHVWLAAPTLPGEPPATDFRVVAPPGERAHLQTDVAALRRASAQTRGRSYDVRTASRLLSELPAGRQVKTDPLPPLALWNHWLLMPLFLTLLVAEWMLRKAGGML